uniref:BRCT domain-containing protein n=1 Tax=Labrus bergylta TaxID=56723 RepID=A0A3Q3FUH9_9LABR
MYLNTNCRRTFFILLVLYKTFVRFNIHFVFLYFCFLARMASSTRVFQISGIKNRDKKRALVQGIRQLGGTHIGGSVYQCESTHLIIPKVLLSEKFLAACASGKWVVFPDYVLESVKSGSWLAEGPFEISIPTGSTSSFYPVRQWRRKVTSGRLKGAFQGWRVLLMVQDLTSLHLFEYIVLHCLLFSYLAEQLFGCLQHKR